MARRGQKRHLKRLPAPRHWPIKRKEGKFTTRVIPGPHPKEHSLTIALILREILGYADTMREVLGSFPDFKYEKSKIERLLVDNYGHIVYMLPKYHCELNPIGHNQSPTQKHTVNIIYKVYAITLYRHWILLL